MKVRELIAVLGYEIEGEGKLQSFDQSVDRLKDGLADLARIAAGVTAAIAAVAFGMNKAARDAADYSEDVHRNAAAFGAAAGEYQSMTFAMNELGGSTDDVRDLMGTLTDRIKDAAQGAKTYQDDFSQLLGIGPDQIARWDKMNPTDKLMEFLDVMERTPDLSDKLTASVRLFGDDLGRRVIPAVTASGQAIRDYMEIAEATGLAMDEALIKKGAEGRQQLRFMDALLQSIKNRIGVELLPVISRLIKIFKSWWETNGKDVLTRLLPEAVAYFSEEITKLGKRFIALNKFVNESLGGWRTVAGVFMMIGTALTGMATAMAAFKIGAGIKGLLVALGPLIGAAGAPLAVIIGKVAALTALIVGIVFAVEDVITYIQGGESVVGDFIDTFKGTTGPLGALAGQIEELIPEVLDFLGELWETGKALWDMVKPFVMGVLAGAIDVIAGILTFVIGQIRLIMAGIRGVMKVIRAIAPILKVVFAVVGSIWAIVGFVIGGIISLLGMLLGMMADLVVWVVENSGDLFDTLLSGMGSFVDAMTDYVKHGLIGPFLQFFDLLVSIFDFMGPFSDAAAALVEEFSNLFGVTNMGFSNPDNDFKYENATPRELLQKRAAMVQANNSSSSSKVEDNSSVTVNVVREPGDSAGDLGRKIGDGVKNAKGEGGRGLPNAQSKANLSGKR